MVQVHRHAQPIGQTGLPVTRTHMVEFGDGGAPQRDEVTDPHKNADFLASVLLQVLVQMTKGPACTVTTIGRMTKDSRCCDYCEICVWRPKRRTVIASWLGSHYRSPAREGS